MINNQRFRNKLASQGYEFTPADAAKIAAACHELFDFLRSRDITWLLEAPSTFFAAIFTSYYGGCGECYAFTLKEVEEGKPFVCWNLD